MVAAGSRNEATGAHLSDDESSAPPASRQQQQQRHQSTDATSHQQSSQAPDSSSICDDDNSGMTRHDSKQTDCRGGSTSNADPSPMDLDAYGLNGILRTVRMSCTPLSLLSLGTDLTTLGLNLNTPDTLYTSFYSPNLDQQPAKEDIEFYLPPCCFINPPNWKMSHLQKFKAETLFYMFYTVVGDALQGYAAAELFNRGWFYHTKYEKWFTTAAAQRAIGASDISEQPPNENTWIYFEPTLWAKRFFTGDVDPSKFLKSDSLRDLLDEPLQATEAVQDQQAALLRQQAAQQARPVPGLLSQQVAGFLSQSQQFGGQSGLGALGGLGFHSGGLSGQRTPMGGAVCGSSHLASHPFAGGGHFQGTQTPPTAAATGFAGLLSGQAGGSSGPAGAGPISMASLQSAIEALLSRGLPQQ